MNEWCPRCGCPWERDVIVGLDGAERGPRYSCGTILQGDYVNVRGVSCVYAEKIREELATARSIIAEHDRFIDKLMVVLQDESVTTEAEIPAWLRNQRARTEAAEDLLDRIYQLCPENAWSLANPREIRRLIQVFKAERKA